MTLAAPRPEVAAAAWREEERRCVAALRGHDASEARRALARLYEVLAPALRWRVILPKVGRADAADDVLAETFCALVERLAQFEDRGEGLWPWLSTVAAHKALDRHRRDAREDKALAAFERLWAPLHEPGAPAFEAEHDRLRVRGRIEAVFARLSPRYRRTLELRFWEERSREDCAAALEIKLATFDVLLLRALRAFRQTWLAEEASSASEGETR